MVTSSAEGGKLILLKFRLAGGKLLSRVTSRIIGLLDEVVSPRKLGCCWTAGASPKAQREKVFIERREKRKSRPMVLWPGRDGEACKFPVVLVPEVSRAEN